MFPNYLGKWVIFEKSRCQFLQKCVPIYDTIQYSIDGCGCCFCAVFMVLFNLKWDTATAYILQYYIEVVFRNMLLLLKRECKFLYEYS